MPPSAPVCPACQAPLPESDANTNDHEAEARCTHCGTPLPETKGAKAPAPIRPGKARSSRSAIVAIAALAVIAVAGVLIFRSIGPELESMLAARRAPKASGGVAEAVAAEEDEGPFWTRTGLSVVRVGEGNEQRPVIVLGHPTGATDRSETIHVQIGILAREIVRQAMLIAARDELGLATRDEVLGDAPALGPRGATAEVASVLRYNRHATVAIERGEGTGRKVLLKRDLIPAAPIYDVVELAAAAEALSRSEFPGALKALGLEGTPNAIKAGAELPESVADRLSGLGFADPFAAVRDLHAAIRSDGESPVRLGALVRGYGLLGVLTEFQWSPASKVFKARALLYAQRLVARDPESPWGYWHRAYVEALVGLHRKALKDLNRAKALAADEKAEAPVPPTPAWVELIGAFARYDLARLRVEDGPDTRFAALLRMLALEFPLHTSVPLRAAKDVLSLDPECFRAHDVMCQVGGVANLHVATTIAPQVLEQIVPRRLRAIGTLPAMVRERIDREAGEIALVEALDRAGEPGEDAGEPSWGVLGHLIRETRFVHVQRRLHFMRYSWAVPVDDYWTEARPYVARHRFFPYLEATALGTPEADRAFAESIAPALPDLEIGASEMTRRLYPIAEPIGKRAWGLAQIHIDHLVRDFARHLELMPRDNGAARVHDARKILLLSPQNPFAMATLIDHDWEHSQDQLARWEKKAADFPALEGALGRRYSELGEYDKAREFLTRYIEEAPEAWAYERLAKNYEAQGDTARWLETLDEYLDRGEDHGLDQARVRVTIADHFMKLGDWAKARPYAEDAAQTWAEWAMRCATRCAEGMKDWGRAEFWVSQTAERYPTSSLYDWFLFCKRTGHGDAEAARDFAERYLVSLGDRPDLVNPEVSGFFYWLGGEPRKALANFRKAYETNASVSSALGLTMIADDLGDSAQRDAILGELCTRHQDKSPKTIQICRLFREFLSQGQQGALDLKAVDAIIESIPEKTRGNTEFFVGWFLRNHGKTEDAQAYLKRCAASSWTLQWARALAIDALRGPGDDRDSSRVDPRSTS